MPSNWLSKRLKYSHHTCLWRDCLAGITGSAIILPKAMAYATLAGLPVAVGLYTAFLPMLIYAFMGSSRLLNVSTTTTIGILTGAQIHYAVPDGDPLQIVFALATLSALVGSFLILGAILRLGFVASFISLPILTGFKAGIGLVIILDQLPKLLGIHINKQGFIRDFFSLIDQLPNSSMTTVLVAASALLILLGMERLKPHSPAPIFVVAICLLCSWLFDWHAQGIAIVGEIPLGLPDFTRPDLSLIEALLPGALGIALMSFTESIAAGTAFSKPSDSTINPSQELVALGTANLVGALFGAMPAGGGTTQTAILKAAGAGSQIASLVTAAIAVATLLALGPLLALLPQATLSAIVIVYSLSLIQPAEFKAIKKVRYMEFLWAIVALIGVLFFGTLQGIVVAIIVSLLGLASQTRHPHVYMIARKQATNVLRPISTQHPNDEIYEGLLIVRPEGRIFFINAQDIAHQIGTLVKQHQPKVLVLDMSRVPDIEYSALKMLIEGEKRVTEHGASLWLTSLNPSVLDVVRRSGFADHLGKQRLLFNASVAMDHYHQLYPEAKTVSSQILA